VELSAPRHGPTGTGNGEILHDALNDAGETLGAELWRWRAEWFAGSVRAKDDVKVNESPTLKFGHLKVVKPDVLGKLSNGDAEVDSHATANLLEGPIPQT
jgi:hypothetical protein